MRIILTETQLRSLISENDSKKMAKGLTELFEDAKNVISTTSEQTKMSLNFMLTWGAALGGIMGPLSEFMKGNYPELTNNQIALILTSVCVMLYTDYKPKYEKLFKKIEEEGLNEEFDACMDKGLKLKNAFVDFLKSLNVTIHSMTNILSYAFLIPLLPMLLEIAKTNYSSDLVMDITKSILGFGIVAVSGNTLKRVVEKILKRFED